MSKDNKDVPVYSIGELIDAINTRSPESEGCTDEEIELLEQKYAVKLPFTYKEFLRNFGKGTNKFMVGTDYTYKFLLDMKEATDELLAENDLPPLVDKTFTCWMHQGYQFAFFYCDGINEDPPVYYFNECNEPNDIVMWSDTFTGMLKRHLDAFDYYEKELWRYE